MAETFTADGLDYLYNAGFRDATAIATYYVGLFVSQTQSTVPASTASGSAAGWTEVSASSGTYARQAIPGASIGSAVNVGGSARGSTWAQVTFTGFTTNPASPINGFVVLSGSTGAASPLFFANFDSGASRALASASDTLAVTPAVRGTP